MLRSSGASATLQPALDSPPAAPPTAPPYRAAGAPCVTAARFCPERRNERGRKSGYNGGFGMFFTGCESINGGFSPSFSFFLWNGSLAAATTHAGARERRLRQSGRTVPRKTRREVGGRQVTGTRTDKRRRGVSVRVCVCVCAHQYSCGADAAANNPPLKAVCNNPLSCAAIKIKRSFLLSGFMLQQLFSRLLFIIFIIRGSLSSHQPLWKETLN